MIINGKKTVLIPHISDRKDAKLEHDEIVATAMLLGEYEPIYCSCCLGAQRSPTIFFKSICGQCDGVGFDMMGRKTRWALVKRYHGEGAEEA